jgi:predicted alpha/beta-hydrolase family hydrolase
MTAMLDDGPNGGTPIILAHGAGAPMDSPFMNDLTHLLKNAGLRVFRFEFPYMADRRSDGKKRPPNPLNTLLAGYGDAVNGARKKVGAHHPIFIGGKSMGGRVASMIADEVGAQGLICLGYPFHPPGRPEKLRTAHLLTLNTPTLILQGERDPFGGLEEIGGYALSPAIDVVPLPDGDHSFKPRKKSGHTLEENLQAAADAMVAFVQAALVPEPAR